MTRSELVEAYPVGSPVEVSKAYRGAGAYVADGNEGRWYVVGHIAPTDLKLARHPGAPWATICHLSRVKD